MSDVLRHKRELVRQGRLLSPVSTIESIEFTPNSPSVWNMRDGKTGNATCLGCHDAPCIEINEQHLGLVDKLSTFPGDPSRDVCPTNAIDWDEGGKTIAIDGEQCIGCGLCALTCPYGAISLNDEGQAVIETSDPDGVTIFDTTLTNHTFEKRVGALSTPKGYFLRELPKVIATLNDTQTTRLVRNMFVACNVLASMRRKGDTNVRLDGVLRFSSGQIGVVEIEVSPNVLESPRALLEDIAVLYSRYGISMADIVPVSVIGSLPNMRAEYYQVIDDIEKVLDIKCRSITLGTLVVLMWHFRCLEAISDNLFTTISGSTDLFHSLKQLIPDLPDQEPYPGAYRPVK